MEECEFVTAPKKEANRILSHLLSLNLVRKDLKIRYDEGEVCIPVKNVDKAGRYKTTKGLFQSRDLPVPPAVKIRKIMESKGSPMDVPSKFIRLGNSMIFKDSRLENWSDALLRHTAEEFGVESIYLDTGIKNNITREPDIKLIYGPGGDVIHREGEIRYSFDPTKIMFSPGNVNIRIAQREEEIEGKTVVDMFAGIGYFSLQAASRSKNSVIYSCEINPNSYHYLEKNISLNSLRNKIEPVFGDCRKLSNDIIADQIIMGHFDCLDFLSNALLHSKKGTIIDFHLLLDTKGINTGWNKVARRATEFGYTLDLMKQTVVKSYGPHLWHVVVKTIVTRAL